MKYADKLEQEGFPMERSDSVAEALDTLHAALSRLDSNGINRFFAVPMEKRLSDFAEVEGVRDVTKDIKRA